MKDRIKKIGHGQGQGHGHEIFRLFSSFRYIGVLLLILFLQGCTHRDIEVRSQYLDKNYLASEQLNTPDPNRSCFIGQKVIVKWRLAECYRNAQNLKLFLTVRYGNYEVAHFQCPISNYRGYYEYFLLNEDYWDKKGMNSYKAEIYDGQEKIAGWLHHTWVEIIEIEE